MAGHARAWFAALGGAVLVVGTVLAAVPATAQERDRGERARAPERGDERDHGRPDERRPERRGRVVHERREAPPVYGYDVPTYVPDPPPVVYAPPAPPVGLSFFFNFR